MPGIPLQLRELAAPSVEESEPDSTIHPWIQMKALETVIDYMVTQYGAGYLPVLLRALNGHDDWEALIPAAFGVPADEFEAGWQDHLAERYGRDRAP
jgi:hypothetical protein